MAQPQIHVLLDDPVVPPEIAAALRRIDAGIRLSRLDRELTSPSKVSADARLVVASGSSGYSGRHLEALCQSLTRSGKDESNPCATLVLTPSPVQSDSISLADGAPPIGFASGLSSDELAGRLSAMCAFQTALGGLNRLHRELAELRERDRARSQGVHQLDEQMRLASQIQRDLLPEPLPHIAGASLHTLYRPADRVSGDIYDVARLSAFHVALSFADATGHGMPAALLTMFIERALRGRTGENGHPRIRAPEEALAELNRLILEADLTQCQFLTGLYAIFDENARKLCWARGGSPYPILVRAGSPPQQLRSDGMLLGVSPEAQCERAELSLEPGDVVIFHTDGLDALLLHDSGRRVYDDLTETPWYQSLRSNPISEQLAELARRLEDTPADAWPVDDLTVLALEISRET